MASAQAVGSSGAGAEPGLALVEEVGVAADGRGEAGQGRWPSPPGASCSSPRPRSAGRRRRPLGGIRPGRPPCRRSGPGRRRPSSRAFAASRSRSSPSPTRIKDAPIGSDDGGPGLEEQAEVLLGMEPAGEDDPRAGRQRRLDPRVGRAGPEVVGVDPAGHPDQLRGGDAEGEPLAFDVGRDRRERGVAEDQPGGGAGTLGSWPAPRPRRNSPSWPAGSGSGPPRATGGRRPRRSPPRAPDGCGSGRTRAGAGGGPRPRPPRTRARRAGRGRTVLIQRWTRTPSISSSLGWPGMARVTTRTECPRRTSSAPCASACRSAPLACGWKWLRT